MDSLVYQLLQMIIRLTTLFVVQTSQLINNVTLGPLVYYRLDTNKTILTRR